MKVLFIGSGQQPGINTLLKKAQVNGELATLSKCPTHPAPEDFWISRKGECSQGGKKKHYKDNSVS